MFVSVGYTTKPPILPQAILQDSNLLHLYYAYGYVMSRGIFMVAYSLDPQIICLLMLFPPC